MTQSNISTSGINWKPDDEGKQVLEVLWNSEGNKADTSKIKAKTGLERHIIQYRYDKFEEEGLVERWTEESKNNLGVTVVQLTEKGEQAIRDGLIGKLQNQEIVDEVEVDREQFDEFARLMRQMDSRLDSTNNRIDTLEQKIDDGDADVDEELLGIVQEQALTTRVYLHALSKWTRLHLGRVDDAIDEDVDIEEFKPNDHLPDESVQQMLAQNFRKE